MRRPYLNGRDRRRGYTLIEALLALIMFTFITLAAGFALSATLQNQQKVRQKSDEMQEARAIFGVLDRDIRQAYASANNPYTFFIATGDSSSAPMLNFTSLSHRVVPGGGTDPTNAGAVTAMPPQSGVSMIGYSLDANSGLLIRTETAVPNPEFEPQPQENVPNYVLSQRVKAIDIEFFDPNSSDPSTPSRSYWSYASNPTAIQSILGNSGGAQQDTQLPTAVQVSVQIVGTNGVPETYSTVIPIAMPTPVAKGQAPDNTIGPVTPTTGTTGGNNGGFNNSGGNLRQF